MHILNIDCVKARTKQILSSFFLLLKTRRFILIVLDLNSWTKVIFFAASRQLLIFNLFKDFFKLLIELRNQIFDLY